MGKIIRYIIYFLLIIAAFVLIRGVFTGSINSNTTIGQAATDVREGSMQTLENMKNSASSAVNKLTGHEPAAQSGNLPSSAIFNTQN